METSKFGIAVYCWCYLLRKRKVHQQWAVHLPIGTQITPTMGNERQQPLRKPLAIV